MRINKYLASSGVASRRECDKLIQNGKVSINGKTAVLGTEVNEGDEVYVDGKQIALKKTSIICLINLRVIYAASRTRKAGKPYWI